VAEVSGPEPCISLKVVSVHASPKATNEAAKRQVGSRAPHRGDRRRRGGADRRLVCRTGNDDRAFAPPKPPMTPSDDEIYTGAILFVPDDGKTCRRFLFDNRTGRLSYNGLVDCESAYYQNRDVSPAQMSIARTQAISETFRHH
jgi:hypothetical protein